MNNMLKINNIIEIAVLRKTMIKHRLIPRNSQCNELTFGNSDTILFCVRAKIKKFDNQSCIWKLETASKIMCNRSLSIEQLSELNKDIAVAKQFMKDIESLDIEFMCYK